LFIRSNFFRQFSVLSMKNSYLVSMEHFIHIGPPLTFGARFQR